MIVKISRATAWSHRDGMIEGFSVVKDGRIIGFYLTVADAQARANRELARSQSGERDGFHKDPRTG